MPTTTLRSGGTVATHPVNSTFTDVVTSIAGAANTPGLLRNLTSFPLVVVKGGGSAPDAVSQGEVIEPYGESFCETANIWVRCPAGSATVCFETL